jgi:hypothetical protein
MVPGVLKVDGDQLLDRRFVFYEKDIGGHRRGHCMNDL